MQSLWQELLYVARSLRRRPVFTVVALLTLTLGVGGATVIFSVFHAVLLRPLPYPDESRVVMVWETEPAEGIEKKVGTPGNYQDWRAETRTINHLSGLAQYDATLTGHGEPLRLVGRRVSASLFAALGVRAVVGRTFVAEDETAGVDVGCWSLRKSLLRWYSWPRAGFSYAAFSAYRRSTRDFASTRPSPSRSNCRARVIPIHRDGHPPSTI